MKKKILILANNDVGLYKFRKELIQELIKQGNDVVIALPYGNLVDKLIDIGCKFIDTPMKRRSMNPISDTTLVFNYLNIIRKEKPNLILTYTIKPNIYGGISARIFKIPYIVNITGLGSVFQKDNITKKLIVRFYKSSLKKVKYVFFENAGNKEVFVSNNIIDDSKSIVMNGAGVNLEEYPFTPMPLEGPTRFLFIGRIMKEKGVDELFEVATRIKKEYKNVEFDIVGPFEEKYEQIVDNLSKQGTINYYGYQEDVKPFIEKCHCFVLPSYHEGMANTLLEAAAMGRPLITSDIHGCKEVFNNNGYLCSIKNTEELYEKIKLFLGTTIIEKNNFGICSYYHVKETFDRSRIINKTVDKILIGEMEIKNEL